MNWDFILIEGYCARLWDYHSKHSKWIYKWEPNIPADDFIKDHNPKYDPKVKVPRKPKYCKKQIGVECVKCKYLAYAEVDDDLKRAFNEIFYKKCAEEGEDE